jgi:hypothetical protein
LENCQFVPPSTVASVVRLAFEKMTQNKKITSDRQESLG